MSGLALDVDQIHFEQLVLESSVPVLVDFWAEWCGPCKVVSPILEEIAGELQGKIRVLKLNVDKNAEVAARFNVMNIPTIIVFKGGQEVERVVGVVSKSEIKKRIGRSFNTDPK